jgi:hypothetical protein
MARLRAIPRGSEPFSPVGVRYGGRVDAARGLGGAPVFATLQFETGDDRYVWLDRIQAVAKGISNAGRAGRGCPRSCRVIRGA